MSSNQYPRLRDVLQSSYGKTANAPKAAAGPTDPGPDSDHPASVDPGNMPVSEGPTITDSEKRNVAARGNLSAEKGGEPIVDKPAVTINTETGKDGEELRGELPINDGIPDPGPEDHPASTPSEKFASITDVAECSKVLGLAVEQMISKLASIEVEEPKKAKAATSPSKAAGMPDGDPAPTDKDGSSKDPNLKNADEVEESDDEAPAPMENKVAQILEELIPSKPVAEGKPAPRKAWDAKIATLMLPEIEEAIARGERLASVMKLAMADPAAAEAMMMADPAMMMADPAMGGGAEGGAPAMGGPEMGGPGMGGGDEESEFFAVIEQIAQERGVPVEEVIAELEAALQGGAMGGGGGESMPAEEPAAPPAAEEAPAEEPPAEDSGSDKTASAPAKGKPTKAANDEALKKIAQALLSEVGKTPAEIAEGVC